jgi:hypothetical protein
MELLLIGAMRPGFSAIPQDADTTSLKEGDLSLLKQELDTPFESIEGAQEYLKLLCAAVLEAKLGVEADVHLQTGPELQRRLEALRLVLYKLEQLEKHVKASHRILNDLRTLRRLLLEERGERAATSPKVPSKAESNEMDGGC